MAVLSRRGELWSTVGKPLVQNTYNSRIGGGGVEIKTAIPTLQNTYDSGFKKNLGGEGEGEGENELKLGGIGSTWRQLPTIKTVIFNQLYHHWQRFKNPENCPPPKISQDWKTSQIFWDIPMKKEM